MYIQGILKCTIEQNPPDWRTYTYVYSYAFNLTSEPPSYSLKVTLLGTKNK